MATDLVGSIVGGKFLVGQNFGGGAFGQIFMATNTQNNEVLALKTVKTLLQLAFL